MKSGDQIKREIDAFLKSGSSGSGVTFHEIIRDDDPASMQVAEDFLLQKGWKMREVAGGMRARNFTIELRPMHGPRDQWKMVSTNVADLGSRSETSKLRPGRVWVKMSAANGPVRVSREREIKSDLDEAKKIAVANAWAVAKAIKALPLDASEAAVARIVNANFTKKTHNLRPEELF
jgi:hypothetical protein